jgi:hypothetical protein
MQQVRELLPHDLWKTMERKLGREEALRLLWPAVVGQKLAAQIQLRQLRGRTLIVTIPDPELRKPLETMEAMILDSVNRFSPQLSATEIEYVVEQRPQGLSAVASATKTATKTATMTGSLLPPKRDGLPSQGTNDKSLRDTFDRSRHKYFARQKAIGQEAIGQEANAK